MNVVLTPEMEALVQRKLNTGDYNNPSQVMQAALQLLDERDRARRLNAALDRGDEQFRRGEVFEWTPELRDEMKQEAAEMARLGQRPNPDVCPD